MKAHPMLMKDAPITVQPRREEAIRAGFISLEGRLPAGFDLNKFTEALRDWDVRAFCKGDEAVGMLMLKGPELHVAVLPEVRGKWLSRRLIRDVIGPLIDRHGEAKTAVMEDNERGKDFVSRIGFDKGHIGTLRQGFLRGTFDPTTALIGAGASLLGSAMQSDAAGNAASQQANAANNASATQMSMFNTVNNQAAPYRQSGTNALGNLGFMLGVSGADRLSPEFFNPRFTGGGDLAGTLLRPFSASDLNENLAPNWKFALDQGQGAAKNALNLTGGFGGNFGKGLVDYTVNKSGDLYQQAYQNYNSNQTNIFNRLASIAGLGQTSNQTAANAGTALAGNAGNAQMAAGAAQAAGTVGSSNALAGGLSNAASWYSLPSIMSMGGGGGGAAAAASPQLTGAGDILNFLG